MDYKNKDPEYLKQQAEIFKHNTDLFFGDLPSNYETNSCYKAPKVSYKGYIKLKDDECEPLLSSASTSNYKNYSRSSTYNANPNTNYVNSNYINQRK